MPFGDASVCSEKMAAPGEKSFGVLEYHTSSYWRYVKDRVFVSPLPRDLADLKARIIAVVKNIDAPILTRVWQEFDFCIDVCRVTSGAHIEHTSCQKRLFRFSYCCEQFHEGRCFGYLIINVCNHGEHYETPSVFRGVGGVAIFKTSSILLLQQRATTSTRHI